MRNLFERYRRLEEDVWDVIMAEVFVQFVNAAFFIAFLLYMQEEGFSDQEATGYFKYRFLGVLVLAFPLGRFLRGRHIRPFFFVSGAGVPVVSLLVLHGVATNNPQLMIIGQLIWGVLFMCMTVTVLPYIMRNASEGTQTAAISLSFSTWSFTSILAGLMIAGLQWIDKETFTNQRLLQGCSVLGLLSLVFLYRIKAPEVVPIPAAEEKHGYDWGRIICAMVPTSLIAIGAGLTIPFMPLFFANIHGFETRHVALMAALTTVGVLFAVILTPWVKDHIGFRLAIPGTQLVAIGMLVALALTEPYAPLPLAAAVAVACYMLRQPLMNMAGPMTSELTMNYVGQRNQELVSALTASIWSGSWFFSGLAFQELRAWDVSYSKIFLITAGLYLLGVAMYYLLILDYDRRIGHLGPARRQPKGHETTGNPDRNR